MSQVPKRNFHAVPHPKLVEDPAQVVLNDVFTDSQLDADVAIL